MTPDINLSSAELEDLATVTKQWIRGHWIADMAKELIAARKVIDRAREALEMVKPYGHSFPSTEVALEEYDALTSLGGPDA